MPDHLHLLVHGTTADATLTPFITMAKQRSGYLFSRRTGARLWQEGYFERAIRSDEDLTAVALYIQAESGESGIGVASRGLAAHGWEFVGENPTVGRAFRPGDGVAGRRD